MTFQGGFQEEEEDSILITLDKNFNNRNNNNNNNTNNNNRNNSFTDRSFLNSSENINIGSSSNNESLGIGSSTNDSGINNDFEMPEDAFNHNQLYLSKGFKNNLLSSNFIIKNGDEQLEEEEYIDDIIFQHINGGGVDGDNGGYSDDGDDENENQSEFPFKRNRSLLEFTQGYEDPDELEISCEGGSTISSLNREDVIADYFEPNVDEQPYYNRLKIKQQQQYQQQQAAVLAYQQQQQPPPSSSIQPMDHHYSERKINIPKVRFNTDSPPTNIPPTAITPPPKNNGAYEKSNDKRDINRNKDSFNQKQQKQQQQQQQQQKQQQQQQQQYQLQKEKKHQQLQLLKQQKLEKKQISKDDYDEEEDDIIEESAGEGDGPDQYSENEDDEDVDLVYSLDEVKSCSCFTPYIKIVAGNKNYTLLWIASLISLAGDWLNEIACLTILANFQTSNIMVSMFLVVRESPPFLFQFLTGVISDTFDRRYVMLAADIIRMVIVLFFLFIRSKELIWLLFVLAFLQYGTGSFYNPSKSALLPSIVPKQDLITANALDQSSYSSMMLLGASFGGAISFAFGTDVNFILDSVTYAASALCIFLLIKNTKNLSSGNSNNNRDGNIELSNSNSNESIIPCQNTDDNNKNNQIQNGDKVSLIKNDQLKQDNGGEDEEDYEDEDEDEDEEQQQQQQKQSNVFKKSIGQSLKDYFSTYKYGFKYLTQNKYIFLIAFSKACGSLIWGVADMINIEIAKTNFKIGDEGSLSLGIILASGGLGILMVPLLFARIIKDVPSNYNKVLKTGFFLNGICTFCLGLSANHFPLYLFFNCFRSSSTCIIWMYSSSILQQLLPDQVRGRVFSTEYALLTLFNTASKILIGLVLDYTTYSPKQILIVSGMVGVFIFFIWLILFKRFKRNS